MKKWIAGSLIVVMGLLSACSPESRQEAQEERYTSPVLQSLSPDINLEAIETAFWASKGTDFGGWMSAFEKRVNEVYQGEGVVSIDAQRKGDRLVVQGFVDQNQTEGLQADDKKLFTLEQTGPATQDAVPYKVTDGQGAVYREGSHSLLDNPFLQAFLVMGMFNWAGSYFTPRQQLVVLRDYRNGYRRTPSYQRQVASNKDFDTRFKQRAAGGVKSRNTFDNRRPTATDTQRRTWDARQRSGGSWAGRRSTGGGGGTRRSWGGRRR